MRRLLLALLMISALAMLQAGPVLGHTASISPTSQTRSWPNYASWYTSWNGVKPFDVRMCPGDGATCQFRLNTNDLAGYFSHRFAPDCVNRTYTNILRVLEKSSGHDASATAYTTELKGFCSL